MSTRQAADRRIRAASLAVPSLDVRGPVSQALARAGVAVPLADAPGETAAPESPPAEPARTASRAKAAPRVLKPFADEPWPTRKAKAEPHAALSGLTADELRVHRILLDTLALQSQQGYGNGTGVVGLSYAEKQRLTVLDLAFIDAEIEKMDHGFSLSPSATRWIAVGGGIAFGMIAGAFVLAGVPEAALGFGIAGFLVLVLLAPLLALSQSVRPATTPRRKIYDALRELALLADPDDVTSDALSQADAVIDRLAGADDGPRLRLDDSPTPTASGAATHIRARS